MRDNAVMKSGGRSYSIRIKETAAKGVTFGFRGGVRVVRASIHLATNKSGEAATNSLDLKGWLAGSVGRFGLVLFNRGGQPAALSSHLNVPPPPRMFSSQSSFFATKPPSRRRLRLKFRLLFARFSGTAAAAKPDYGQLRMDLARTRKPFL